MRRLKKIIIEFIDHKNQRLGDVGDWFYEDDGKILRIKISHMSTEQREFLCAIHEFIETALCRQANITQKQIDRWDETHPPIPVGGDDEKENIGAPHFDQHARAKDIERILCHFFGDNWVEYEKELDFI